MIDNQKSVQDLMANIDHVEKTSEGLLKGGFAIIGGGGISPLGDNGGILCINSGDCGNCGNCVQDCGKPTSKKTSGNAIPPMSLSF